ncbi:MAG TPA: hypothetical protein VM925_32120 [Labilithrix sp.]|nr:hypothetical protein [Labilithrix sp.]
MSIDLARALPYFSPAHSADVTAPFRPFGSIDAPVARPFSATLVITYMIDEPGALLIVRQRDMERSQHGELHERAIRNLRNHATQRRVRAERSGATWSIRLDGQHDASLLLLDELWDPPTRIVDSEGEVVVAVSSRATVLATGTATRGGITALQAAVSVRERPMSSELFVRRAGAWKPYAG